MKLIVGLGNPGREFAQTRHNVGYKVIDAILKHYPNFRRQKKFSSYIFSGEINGEKVLLLKPLTFVNLSGESVVKAVEFFGVQLSDLLVIVDDFSLNLGKVRIRFGGSSGGHRGLSSIISSLKNDKFWRCRIGIKNENFLKIKQENKITEFVLGEFEKEEKEIIKKAIDMASLIVTGTDWCAASYDV